MDSLTTHSGSVLHLGGTLTQQLRQTLIRYCQESEIRYAALLEESGTTCVDAGDSAFRDSGETAALAVGAYAALQAVASRLGDGTFEGFFHEGRTRQFCLTPVTPQFMLLSVFEAPVRFAVVKLCAAKAVVYLQEQIETMPIRNGEAFLRRLIFPPPAIFPTKLLCFSGRLNQRERGGYGGLPDCLGKRLRIAGNFMQ